MRKALPLILIGLLLLSPAFCRAQRSPVTHNFHTDSGDATKLRFANGNKTGITPLLTYTCSNNATFGTYIQGGMPTICLNLLGNGDFVTTTAVDSLRGITVSFYPSAEKRPKVKLYLSRDSIHWSDSIVPEKMHNVNGVINADFIPGRYYVRLVNTVDKKQTYVRQIQYRFGDCNCLMYIPEE